MKRGRKKVIFANDELGPKFMFQHQKRHAFVCCRPTVIQSRKRRLQISGLLAFLLDRIKTRKTDYWASKASLFAF